MCKPKSFLCQTINDSDIPAYPLPKENVNRLPNLSS